MRLGSQDFSIVRRRSKSLLAMVSLVSPLFLTPSFTPTSNALSLADCVPTVTGFVVNSSVTYEVSGSNCIITFLSGSGTWTPPAGVDAANVLVVAGGGGGGGF